MNQMLKMGLKCTAILGILLVAGCRTTDVSSGPANTSGKSYRQSGQLHFVKLAPVGSGFQGEATLIGDKVIAAVRPIDETQRASGESREVEYRQVAKRFAEEKGCASWPGSGSAVLDPGKKAEYAGKGYWTFTFKCI